MKKAFLLFISVISLASCCKEQLNTPAAPLFDTQANAIGTAQQTDTIPDKAAVRIKVSKDSVNANETLLVFSRTASPGYLASEDASYMAGFGQVNIASISNDNHDLSINTLPYRPEMCIGLDVYTRTSGTFTFSVSYQNNMPGDVQVWLKDTYLKDSVNICNSNYSFDVNKADTSSFGNKRFKLVFKKKVFVQTASPN